ncbi:SOS-induced cell division inhibitor SulA [Azotobacter vinelandii]|uniref:SOS-induced cell division inhibitor SulA n=1 Tax=Azotobacter vinelandii TaxID=354 RepID=UPI002665E563|nr:SOS-induced cell division inhibitor SulA [Azotobacter vinelandii]WKN23432.1 CDP-glycerol--UDP-pyrophosphoryl-N-acetylglucosaminyl-N-acetylmannosamine glycerophosphotransferase [Azotobacter vinelandii]
MQLSQSLNAQSLPFEAALARPSRRDDGKTSGSPAARQTEPFSELSLRGDAGQCLFLLAPMLRELSQGDDGRWLTLVAPPANLSHGWLREAGLNRERILLLHPSREQEASELACEALRLGRSHTVVSWLDQVSRPTRHRLLQAARIGRAQSLNIRLG